MAWTGRELTPQEFYDRLSPSARKELCAPCWRAGLFTATGQIACIGGFQGLEHGSIGHPNCRLEYLCEVMAVSIMLPKARFLPVKDAPLKVLARAFDVPPYVVVWAWALYES